MLTVKCLNQITPADYENENNYAETRKIENFIKMRYTFSIVSEGQIKM